MKPFMKPFVSMVRANLKMNVRNRMNLFWLLVFPAIFILLFGYLIGGNSNFSAGVGVVNGGATPVSKQMVSAMKKSKIFELQNGSKKDELQKLKDGKTTAVIAFPEKAVQGKPLQVQSYIDQSKQGTSQATASAIQQIAERFNQQAAGPTPQIVALDTRGIQSKNLRFIDFLVPGLLGMSIMNNGLIGLSSAFVVMRERGILRRVRGTPFPLISFIAARVLTQLLIALLQATILLGMAKIAFNLSMGRQPAQCCRLRDPGLACFPHDRLLHSRGI
ncbi:MAG: ABC transporter permease [Rubrobacteraceae bacterium]